MQYQKRGGFTLIEMLVVVAIIGLLSSIIVIGLGSSRAQARDAARISDVRQIAKWAESQYSNVTGYPETGTVLPIPADSQGNEYHYQRDVTNRHIARVGICLELANDQATKEARLCPSTVTGCQYFFCTEVHGGGSQ